MKKNKTSKIEREREEKREQVRKDGKKPNCSKRKRRERSRGRRCRKEEKNFRIEKRVLFCEERTKS